MSLLLNGTSGISGVDGTAATPALQGTDANTGVSFGTDTVTINTGGVARVTTDASGNVGIGTVTPNTAFHVVSSNTQAKFEGSVQGSIVIQKVGTQGMSLYSNAVGTLAFYDNNAGLDRMRLDSAGNLLLGTPSQIGAGRLCLRITGSSGIWGITTGSTTTDGYPMVFDTTSGQAGFIFNSGTTTTYSTTSDYRLKKNVTPMTGALDKIVALNPVTYNWKHDGSSGQGFIAHELQAIVPDCVTGEKDAVDAEGKPKYQGVDTSFLVATLVSAIQEQQTIIQSLTSRLEALENK